MQMNYNQNLALNILLTFQSNSTALYNWKFKAKQIIANLINALLEYNILLNPLLLNPLQTLEISLYRTAQTACLEHVLTLVIEFQNLLHQYKIIVFNLQKLLIQAQTQKQSLIQKITKNMTPENKVQPFTEKQKDYNLLVLELLEVTTILIKQYQQQHELITCQSIDLLGPLFRSSLNEFSIPSHEVKRISAQLEFLLMHVQYQTKIIPQHRNQFLDSLSKVSHKKAQLHH